MPARLRGQPAGHVGELGPGPWLHTHRRHRLEHGVFNALGAAIHPDKLMGTSAADSLSLLVNEEQDEGQAEDAHDAGACGQRGGCDIFAGGSMKCAVLKFPFALLDLQLHEAMSHLPGVGLAVTFPPELHGVTAVIPTVLQRQVHHHDVEGAVVVRDKLHTVVAALPPEGGFLGAVARQFVVPAEVVVQLLLGDVADVPLVGAALVPRPAEVPGFVEQVVALGQGAADPAGQGDVLALGADAERVRGGDQESCCPSVGSEQAERSQEQPGSGGRCPHGGGVTGERWPLRSHRTL